MIWTVLRQAGSLVSGQHRIRWFESPSRLGEKSANVILSKELNPNRSCKSLCTRVSAKLLKTFQNVNAGSFYVTFKMTITLWYDTQNSTHTRQYTESRQRQMQTTRTSREDK